MAPARRLSFFLLVAVGACCVLLAAGGAAANQLKTGKRTLSGLPSGSVSPPPPPPPGPPGPPPPTGSWLPACSAVNVGSGYTLIATAASSPVVAQPAAEALAARAPGSGSGGQMNSTERAAAMDALKKERDLDGLTGAEFLASIGKDPSFSPPPRSLPINNVDELSRKSNDTLAGAAVCSNDVAYTQGPTASKTVCKFTSCFNGGQRCYTCSGTFVGDPSGTGRNIFLTASHCAAESVSQTLTLSSSYVNCNRGGSDGIFRATGASISTIDFNQGYGIADGAFILVAPQSDTNPSYAARLAIGAIMSTYFSTSVPNYSAGFPQVDNSFTGCSAGNLGDTSALHYARRNEARTLVSTGIRVGGIPACGGNSGGPLVDEDACVVYGVLSSATVGCSGGFNYINFSRLTDSGATPGVNVPALSSALVAGQVNFV